MGSNREAVARYVAFYETLTPESVSQLALHVTSDVYFRDPFNEVRSVEQYCLILSDMFRRCQGPKFTVEETVVDGSKAFLRWRFLFGSDPRNVRQIVGASEILINEAGLVVSHIDYWDTAQVYESIPLLGWVLSAIRRSLKAA